MPSDKYVGQAVKDVKEELKQIDKKLPKKAATPICAGYRPESDSTRELKDDQVQAFQKHIRVLRWICKLGRVDILVAVSMLSRYSAAP